MTFTALYSYLTNAWNTTIDTVSHVIPCSLYIREHWNSLFRPFVIIYFKAVYLSFRNFLPSNCNKTTCLGGCFLSSGYSASESQNCQVLFFLDWVFLRLCLTEWISFSIVGVYFILTKIVGILLHINLEHFVISEFYIFSLCIFFSSWNRRENFDRSHTVVYCKNVIIYFSQ